jgi:hypothetical protein
MATAKKTAAKKTVNKVETKKPAKAERKARTGTKMVKALEIIKNNPALPRKAIIAKFISDAKLTKAGANTYYSLCMKKIK